MGVDEAIKHGSERPGKGLRMKGFFLSNPLPKQLSNVLLLLPLFPGLLLIESTLAKGESV